MATTNQRRRQLARQRWEKQQARRAAAAARARRRRRVLIAGLVVLLVAGPLVAGLVIWSPWSGGDDATTAEQSPAPTSGAEGPCAYTATGTAVTEQVGLPPATPLAAATATLTLEGKPVTIELLADRAPCTVGSLVHLASLNYFDATTCHRLTTSDTLKVLQCGDPTATGIGGPGYQFSLENTEGATYPAGTVAMARAADDPGSNGSQFFLVYGDSTLPPDYTVFGRITEGLEVVSAVAARGTADGSTDGRPKQQVRLDDLVTSP
ncbi:MAG: peptidylprolyl isomerase [Jiangellaceae bacterium]|nr:peptidylprolyl isomerase [Jiangellaceae bacterium]